MPDTETVPVTLGVAKAVVNAADPPEPAVPDTTRRALLSCAVDFVNPVGAVVWTNSITVPEGITVPLAPLDAAVIKPFALTVMLALVNEPTFELTVASVPAAVTLPDPLNDGLV